MISHRLLERDYTTSIEAPRRAIAVSSHYPVPYRWLAAAFGPPGQPIEAREALRQAETVPPGDFGFYTKKRPPHFRVDDYNQSHVRRATQGRLDWMTARPFAAERCIRLSRVASQRPQSAAHWHSCTNKSIVSIVL
jgi:hypothetical protein